MKKLIQPIRFLIQLFFMVGLFLPMLPFADTIGQKLFLSIVFIGVFFCGFVCPFGTIQDWISWISRKLHIPRFQIPRKFQNYLQSLRYFFYALSITGTTFFFLNARFEFNHKTYLAGFEWTVYGTIIFFLIATIFIDRPFCNYFCPKGASYGILSVMRLLSISRNDDECIHCKLCDKACPMNVAVEQTDFIRHPNCINCMQCICTCPKSCLQLKFLSAKKQKGENI